METQQLLEAVQTIETIKLLFSENQNEWLPVIAAIGGAFIGGVSTFFPTYIIEARKRRHEKDAITTALLSEISALLKIVEHRKYLDSVEEAVAYLKENTEALYKFSVRIPEHYSRVYQFHVANIGIVNPSLAASIIEFHQLIDAVVQDVTLGGPIAETGGDAEAFEELLAILKSAISIGQKITSRLG
ncbi:conserved hypothetical protein [Pseudomonas sp. 9AZ]|uniref:hypothetical protein n=1 Tax=Pseudomonas sp. 9AZ TaxID=2653168 RepID=UPI0012F07C19|nr:hypothetical protein [Pseudomonas sp. 9AZ]VXC15602.1 conserved hypothetical protein [Pseudomonas sp. 9AZ]